MKRLDGKTALVTGASSGIGLCFCRELARRGCSLVMISNQDTLESIAETIAAESGVAVHPFFCDLTDAECGKKILNFLDSRLITVDYLINNAGIFSFKKVLETNHSLIDCFIDLHIRAVTELSRLFAARFIERREGRILNMSSMSCWMPMPGIALYSASKAYIRVFSRALHYEVKRSGVSVTVACPGGIATDLFGLPEHLKRLAVNLRVLTTPERFAKKAIDKMLKGKKQYINGWLNRFSIFLVSIMPTCVRMQILRLLEK